jgi:hypothetical protein
MHFGRHTIQLTSYRSGIMFLVGASGGMVDALASGASVPRDVEVQALSRVPIIASLIGLLFSNRQGKKTI